jgi:hypothetical protein
MEENKIVTLKLIDFNDLERSNLQVILGLATRALKKKWQLVSSNEVDFFLFSVDASQSLERQKDFPAERSLFCRTASTIQAERSLLVDENRLPSLSALVALLNRVSVSPAVAAEIKPPTYAEPIAIGSAVFFDPQQGLLGHLLAAEQEQLVLCLSDRVDYAPLYIDVKKNAYYSQNSLEQMDAYVADPDELLITPCSQIEIEKAIMTEKLEPQPLKNFIWYISIKTSAGKVIKGHLNTDIITLKGWPNMRLFKCMEYANLITFMRNNAAPLEMIAEQIKMPLAAVNDFYNACYLMGLIEQRNKIEIKKKNISSERLDLLTQIGVRLK